jgi:hypothetical protein
MRRSPTRRPQVPSNGGHVCRVARDQVGCRPPGLSYMRY